MTTRQQIVQRKAAEAKAIAKVSKRTRKLFKHRLGLTPLQQRESNRVLYGVLQQLRAAGCGETAMAKGLGVSVARVAKLYLEPPTEEQIAAREAEYAALVAEKAARWRAAFEAMLPELERKKQERHAERNRWLAEQRQRELDEKREISAQNLECLIECLEDMRQGWVE